MSEFHGFYRGICTTNNDPEGRNRIKAVVPQVFGSTTTESGWAWPSQPPTVQQAVPLPNQGVWITFEGGDENYPVWVGVWDYTVSKGGGYTPPTDRIIIEQNMTSVNSDGSDITVPLSGAGFTVIENVGTTFSTTVNPTSVTTATAGVYSVMYEVAISTGGAPGSYDIMVNGLMQAYDTLSLLPAVTQTFPPNTVNSNLIESSLSFTYYFPANDEFQFVFQTGTPAQTVNALVFISMQKLT